MNTRRLSTAAITAMALIAATTYATSTFAAGGHSGDHGHGEGHGEHMTMMVGEPGDLAAVSRTVNVTMYDNYYEPENLDVTSGETVRFVVTNAGAFVHEFNIATAAMHEAHAPEMKMMVDHGVLHPERIDWDAAKAMQESMGHGMHEEPNSLLLEPGQSGEIVWKFPETVDLEFACNVPGHYDAGMVGTISLGN